LVGFRQIRQTFNTVHAHNGQMCVDSIVPWNIMLSQVLAMVYC